MIYINQKKVESFTFPGGERHVRVDPQILRYENQISASIKNSDDIIDLLLTFDAIRKMRPGAKKNLLIPYFPYARQDRVCNQGEAFSLGVMAELINSLCANKVTVFDPHSEMVRQLVNNCEVVDKKSFFREFGMMSWIEKNEAKIAVPDEGALKEVGELAASFGQTPIICTKKRDTKTGALMDFAIKNYPVYMPNAIIVDDICDGGGTFIGLAQKFKELNPSIELYLYVTHGIFSKGLEVLKPHFKHIFCIHTYLDDYDDEFLTVKMKGI